MNYLYEKDEANPLETRCAVQDGPAQISYQLKWPTSSLVLVFLLHTPLVLYDIFLTSHSLAFSQYSLLYVIYIFVLLFVAACLWA